MAATRHRSAVALLVSLAFGPGLLAHEYAHAVACRCCGVEVRSGPSLNPFGAAVVEHDPVRSFWKDLTIATAPIVGNSLLAIAAFAAAVGLEGSGIGAGVGAEAGARAGVGAGAVAALGAGGSVDALPLIFALLGACFGMTAVPSPADTARLLETARELPIWMRPVGLLVAAAVRAFTVRSVVSGLTAFAWTVALYVAVTGTLPA